MESKQKQLAIGVTATLFALGGLFYLYRRNQSSETPTVDKADEEVKVDETEWLGFEDPDHSGNHFLTKKEA